MWQPVALANLPLVLCGPMLRRVDPQSVTVFFALRDPRKVTVRVYASEQDGAGVNEQQRGTRATVRLAQNVHVVAVTTADTALQPLTLYRYQVAFGPHALDETPVPETGENLFIAGVMDASATRAREVLVYPGAGNPQLPSFVTPPSDPNRLRLVHASCRKAHGEGLDVMPEIDKVVAGTAALPSERPHQLILTGDQIYADDVADAVLAIIRRNSLTLGMPTERLTNAAGTADLPIGVYEPGRRQETCDKEARFRGEASKSHLWALREFIGMYLLVWSDVLWPDQLPEFPDVYPDERRVLGDKYDTVVGGGSVRFEWLRSDETKRALALLQGYLSEVRRVTAFKSGLRDVRRLLANTPTLMILDDHEVTDDWYMTKAWTRSAALPPLEGSALGRRIIQNGLATYAVFQAWGNTPAQFAATGPAGEPGRALLEKLSVWNGTENPDSAEIARRVGLLTGMDARGIMARPAGALTYHYAVTWTNHQVVFLDTRTFRVFPGGPEDPPALLYDDPDLTAMLAAPGDLGTEAVTVVVSAAPFVDVPIVAEVAKPLVAKLHDRYFADLEAWGLHPGAYHKLLARLFTPGAKGTDGVRRRRIVLLGGDVHHGYAAKLRYRATKPYASGTDPVEGVLAQFVSSALQNEDRWTRLLQEYGYLPGDQIPRAYIAGWANPSGASMVAGIETYYGMEGEPYDTVWRIEGTPAIAKLHPNRTITATEEWTVAIEFLRHTEADPATALRPGNPGAVTNPAVPPQQALAQYLAAATNLDGYTGQWGSGKEIVGYPNFGDIRFTWGAGDQKSASQTLWWRLPGAPTAAPLTKYVATLPLGGGGAPLYGGFMLREGDRDGTPPTYGGAQQPAGTQSGYVAQLQNDLLELGFSVVGTATGVFDRNCRWAVRELQSYAKGTHVARDGQPSPRPPRYSESLESVSVPSDQRYAGPVSGVVDLPTQAVVRRWKDNRWRCPVVIEAWTMSGGLPQAIFQIPASGTTPARPADNIWRHDDMTSNAPRVFAVDFSRTYTTPTRAPDASNHPELIVLGAYSSYQQFGQSWAGSWANPSSRHTWRPEAEMLPQHMLPLRPSSTTGPTLPQLVADRASSDTATADRAARQLSTYKVVRAVAEIEALGYFDVYNTYDTAFMSCGPCHWTAGPTIEASAPQPAKEEWAVDRGELWAFLSYLRSADRAAFDVLCAHYGLDVSDAWGVDGADLWVSDQRKYTSRPTLTNEAGVALPIPALVKEFDLFRSWHWAYRFAMCGRTVDGYRRRMHNMARQRLVDVLGTPWDSPAAAAATTVANVPTGVPDQTRRAKIGDVFASERAVAMIMRWHVLSPGGMVRRGPSTENQPVRSQGRAGSRIRDAYDRARAARSDLNWNAPPTTWGNAHEGALVNGIWDEADEVGGEMERTIQLVRDWPSWGTNPRGWSLPLTDLPADERNLLVARNSFRVDAGDLPNGAGT